MTTSGHSLTATATSQSRNKNYDDKDCVDYEQTATSFSKNRYLPIRNLLPKDMLEYFKAYYSILRDNNSFVSDVQCPSSLSLAGDPAFDTVLEWLRPKISRLVGFDLTSTYSYTRIYSKGEVLKRHTDRAASEISLTVSIKIPDGAAPSEIFLKPPRSKQVKVEMLEGDGCLYAGIEVEHWRKAFRDDGYIQLFLFFIDSRGKFFPKHAFDERRCLGAQKHEGLLVIDGAATSVRSLLVRSRADLREDLVNRLLVEAAVKASPQVTVAEIEDTVDAFRVSHSLFSGDETQHWLDETGLTMHELRTLMALRVRESKLRKAIVAERVRPYFDAHKQDFDLLTVFRVETSSAAAARALAKAAQNVGLWAALDAGGSRVSHPNGTRETHHARDIPELASAAVNAVVGPSRSASGFSVGQLLRRKPARFDRATGDRIEELLFTEWLAGRRQEASVQWHWT